MTGWSMVTIRDFLRPKEFVAELLGDDQDTGVTPHAGTFLMVLVGKAAAVSLAQVEVSHPALGDSWGENGHSLGAIFHQPGRERRTPSNGVPIHQGSFV